MLGSVVNNSRSHSYRSACAAQPSSYPVLAYPARLGRLKASVSCNSGGLCQYDNEQRAARWWHAAPPSTQSRGTRFVLQAFSGGPAGGAAVQYSKETLSALRLAKEAAGSFGCIFVEPDFLLLGLLRNEASAAATLVRQAGVLPEVVEAKLQQRIVVPVAGGLRASDVDFSPATKQVITYARDGCQEQYHEQRQQGSYSSSGPVLGTAHLLLVLLLMRVPAPAAQAASSAEASSLSSDATASSAPQTKPEQRAVCSLPALLQECGASLARIEGQLLDLIEQGAEHVAYTALPSAQEQASQLVSQYRYHQAQGKLDPSSFKPAAVPSAPPASNSSPGDDYDDIYN